MKRILFLMLALCAIGANAQFKVTGVVTDTTSVGEPYATIRIYNGNDTTRAIKLGTTDADGNFAIFLPKAGKYNINISSTGKMSLRHNFELTNHKPVCNLDTLTMRSSTTILGEVEVVAQRPLIKTEVDRIAYDVQADDDSKTNPIFEILKKVPLVTVDGEDNILVNGKADFKIFKNGRPNSSWSRNPREVLKSVPASIIKRIEVITTPGAKYDAEGVSGILNIVTNEQTSIAGVMGSVYSGYDTNNGFNSGTYITTQVGRWTTSVNGGYNYIAPKKTYSDGEHTFVSSGSIVNTNSHSTNEGGVGYLNLESSFEIDTLNLLTMSVGGYAYSFEIDNHVNETMTSATGNKIYSYSMRNYLPHYRYLDFNGKVDYQHLTSRKDEALTLSYLISTTNQNRDSDVEYLDRNGAFPLPYDEYSQQSKLMFYEHTFQCDWTRPWGNGHRIDAGAKYILRTNDSRTSQEFSNDSTWTNKFEHDTHIGALYTEYAYNSSRWGARAGLRYEIARINAKDPSFHSTFNDVVPTIGANYRINNANSLRFNFAVRISRPGIDYLSPAVSNGTYTEHKGNPNLSSSRYNSFSLNHTLVNQKLVLNTSLQHGFTNDMFYLESVTENNKQYTTYKNGAHSTLSTLSLYLQWRATTKTQLMVNSTLGYCQFSNDHLGIRNTGGYWSCFAQLTQQLPWNLRLTASGHRMDSGINGLYEYNKPVYMYSFSLQRSFLKENRLTVTLNANNPFSSNYRNSEKVNELGDYLGYTRSATSGSKMVALNVSFRFGSLKAYVKRTNKTIENTDLEGRK